MNATIYIQIISLIYSLMLMVVYFSKTRLNILENKIYKCLIIINFIGIILDVVCAVLTYNMVDVKFFNILVVKFYLMYFVTWMMAFSAYTFAISVKNKEKVKKYLFINLIFYVIYTIIVFILPLNFVKTDSGMYSNGLSVSFVYFIVALYISSCLVLISLNIKNVFSKKYIPLIVFLTVGVIVMYIQKVNPTLILIPATETFITILMYFTIENPDLKLIEELKKNRSLTSKSYIEKSNFLFRMSAELRKPINNIKKINDCNIELNDIAEIKENSKVIDSNIRSANFTINNVLDVTSLDSKKIKISNDKFNLLKLLNEVKLREVKKVSDIRFDFNISSNLPEYLYGDSIKVKQVLMTLIDKSIERTKKGFIEVNVDCINKYDVCRLIITIEDSSTPLSLSKINEILNMDYEIEESDLDSLNVDMRIINKLISMMNGSLMIKSNEGNEIIVVFDNVIGDFKNEEIINDTDILLISNDERLLKYLESLLKEYTVNSVMNGIDAVDLIKSGEHYNLIIVDDEMKPISGLDTLKSLKEKNINIPCIVMLDDGKERLKKHYIKDGFVDYILKSDLKNEVSRKVL